MNNWADERDNIDIAERRLERIKELEKELKIYKKGFGILYCYFDSISDEEQPKVSKKLEKLGL